MRHFIRNTYIIFWKELQQELRTRYAFNTILAFVVSALLLILFTLKAHQLEPIPKAGLIWIVILFTALAHLARSFVMEAERLTLDLLRLHSRGITVFLGKWLYNSILTLVVNGFTFAIYMLLMQMRVLNWPGFILLLVVGSASLASITTLMASLVAQAERKGLIYSVVSIPLLIPLILLLVQLTKISLVTGDWSTGLNDTAALIGYFGATLSAGLVLFDYVWEA